MYELQNKTLTNKIDKSYLLSFSLLGLFPIVPLIAKPFLLLPLVLTSIINIVLNPKTKVDWKKVIVSASIFFLFLLSVIYSSDTQRAFKLLFRLSPFLVLPFGFAMVPKNIYNKLTETFMWSFAVSCGLFCIVMFVYCITLNTQDLYYLYSHISREFWGYEEHPIYISLYLGIALIIMYFNKRSSILKIGLFAVIIFTLLFLSRKGNVIGLILIFSYILISNSKKMINVKSLYYAAIGLLIIVGTSFLFNNILFMRFKEVIDFDQSFYNQETSTGIRSILWKTSLGLSIDSPLIGYGLGSVQNVINESLIKNGYEGLTTIHIYNSHNQYLQTALTTGYIGLAYFLSTLYFVYDKIKQNKRSVAIFLYIVFCFMFESMLQRQNGVIIAALFFNMFLFLPTEKAKINE